MNTITTISNAAATSDLLSQWDTEDWLASSISSEVEEAASLLIEQEREEQHLLKLQEEAIEAAPSVSFWDVLTSPLGEIKNTLKEWQVSRKVSSAEAELAHWDEWAHLSPVEKAAKVATTPMPKAVGVVAALAEEATIVTTVGAATVAFCTVPLAASTALGVFVTGMTFGPVILMARLAYSSDRIRSIINS